MERIEKILLRHCLLKNAIYGTSSALISKDVVNCLSCSCMNYLNGIIAIWGSLSELILQAISLKSYLKLKSSKELLDIYKTGTQYKSLGMIIGPLQVVSYAVAIGKKDQELEDFRIEIKQSMMSSMFREIGIIIFELGAIGLDTKKIEETFTICKESKLILDQVIKMGNDKNHLFQDLIFKGKKETRKQEDYLEIVKLIKDYKF